MAAKQGFLMYYSKGDAIGTRVSVRYRRSGRLSEVVVKRGSTVIHCTHTNRHTCSLEMMTHDIKTMKEPTRTWIIIMAKLRRL